MPATLRARAGAATSLAPLRSPGASPSHLAPQRCPQRPSGAARSAGCPLHPPAQACHRGRPPRACGPPGCGGAAGVQWPPGAPSAARAGPQWSVGEPTRGAAGNGNSHGHQRTPPQRGTTPPRTFSFVMPCASASAATLPIMACSAPVASPSFSTRTVPSSRALSCRRRRVLPNASTSLQGHAPPGHVNELRGTQGTTSRHAPRAAPAQPTRSPTSCCWQSAAPASHLPGPPLPPLPQTLRHTPGQAAAAPCGARAAPRAASAPASRAPCPARPPRSCAVSMQQRRAAQIRPRCTAPRAPAVPAQRCAAPARRRSWRVLLAPAASHVLHGVLCAPGMGRGCWRGRARTCTHACRGARAAGRRAPHALPGSLLPPHRLPHERVVLGADRGGLEHRVRGADRGRVARGEVARQGRELAVTRLQRRHLEPLGRPGRGGGGVALLVVLAPAAHAAA